MWHLRMYMYVQNNFKLRNNLWGGKKVRNLFASLNASKIINVLPFLSLFLRSKSFSIYFNSNVL